MPLVQGNDPPAAIEADERFALLRVTLTPGVGPVLTRRLLARFGTPSRALLATARELEELRGVGAERARRIVEGFARSASLAEEETKVAADLGARIVTALDDAYPPLLRPLADAPALLFVRGELTPERDRYSVAIVGSRDSTSYGREQADRFGAGLAEAGLTVVSGGARGIDSAAHRGAARAKGRTVVVLGCGLAHCYPPENAGLFDDVVAAGGAIVSELPLRTAPAAENFPARNRIISGMSLGVVVIEAARGSGALITARHAVEKHGREVMAVPGRVDSPASEGSLELLKSGGAGLVCSPKDVIDQLEPSARHAHAGVHASATARPDAAAPAARPTPSLDNLSASQRTILEALAEPRSLDDLARATALDAGVLRADVTLLELKRLVKRNGSELVRA